MKKENNNYTTHVLFVSTPMHSSLSLLYAFSHLFFFCYTAAVASELGFLLLIEIFFNTDASIISYRWIVNISSPYS